MKCDRMFIRAKKKIVHNDEKRTHRLLNEENVCNKEK